MDKYKNVIEMLTLEGNWEAVLEVMDRAERNNNKREQRRHVSFELYTKYFQLSTPNNDIGFIRIAGLSFNHNDERIVEALELLSPSQRDVIDMVYFKGLSKSEYAALRGIARNTVSVTHNRALVNLRKHLCKGCKNETIE